MESAIQLASEINDQYLNLHKKYEDHFWSTKMNLKGNSRDDLTNSKSELDTFLSDKSNLNRVTEELEKLRNSGVKRSRDFDDVVGVLEIMQKTFKTYELGDDSLRTIKDEILKLEQELAKERGSMKLGYTDPVSKKFVDCSSVQLKNKLLVEKDVNVRKACYESLYSISEVVPKKLGEIVKLRNKLARSQGYEDFYDYNVSMAEGFSKKVLFEMMDGLEKPSRPLNLKARKVLEQEKNDLSINEKTGNEEEILKPLNPWNIGFYMKGSIETDMDPYFPFENAVKVWGELFSGLKLNYKNSVLNLDLLDRQGKYSNGFCHWPIPAYRNMKGEWVSSVANFTSLASPGSVGSGRKALITLCHEAGHSCHFSNIDPYKTCGSPLLSQERAPQSIAYAENQSMFLDSLVDDGDFIATYAKDRDGKVMPIELLEKKIRSVHPYEVFELRRMLAVPYFEKSLYELSDEQLSNPDAIRKIATEVEMKIIGGVSPLPLLAIPHILSGESSCYYHGYVLAECSVQQTRKHFIEKYGYITGNEKVGKDLTEVYWKPGASKSFLDIVKDLTEKKLSPDAWLEELSTPVDIKVKQEKEKYNNAKDSAKSITIDVVLKLVHGDDLIADSTNGGFEKACEEFKDYVAKNF